MDLMTIGEFSKVCRLSIKSLRHYDDLDLLKPAEVDPSSGYRLYDQGQVTDGLIIAILRSLDMPLADIAEVLNELPSGGADVLKRHRLRLEERVERESRLLDHVERLIDRGGLMGHEVTVKDMPSLTLAAIKIETSPDNVGRDLNRAYGELFGYLMPKGIAPVDVPICYYHSWEPGNYVIEAAVPVGADVEANGEIHELHISGGRSATVMHVGPYEQLGLAHRSIERWFTENGHKISEDDGCYERYVTDPTQTEDPADYETEVIWPLID